MYMYIVHVYQLSEGLMLSHEDIYSSLFVHYVCTCVCLLVGRPAAHSHSRIGHHLSKCCVC